MTPEESIEILWEYHHVKQELRPADLIFILGSNDVRVAEYAAELYARKLAPLLLFSGGMGRFTGEWAVPEAELFAEAAMKKGVPEDRILIENKSTNTGENVRFSRTILKKAGIPDPASLIALQKPYMERRTLGYAPGPVAGSAGGGQLPSRHFPGILDPGTAAGAGCLRHGGGLPADTGIPQARFFHGTTCDSGGDGSLPHAGGSWI